MAHRETFQQGPGRNRPRRPGTGHVLPRVDLMISYGTSPLGRIPRGPGDGEQRGGGLVAEKTQKEIEEDAGGSNSAGIRGTTTHLPDYTRSADFSGGDSKKYSGRGRSASP